MTQKPASAERPKIRRYRYMPVHRRLIRRIIVTPENCWEWTGTKDKGYGLIRVDGRQWKAHRWSYTYFREPIPEGLTIDHLCKNRGCVNPWHLEAVTIWENVSRSMSPIAINARRTHCVNGHEFNYANTKITPMGHRRCRTCAGLRQLTEPDREEAS